MQSMQNHKTMQRWRRMKLAKQPSHPMMNTKVCQEQDKRERIDDELMINYFIIVNLELRNKAILNLFIFSSKLNT